MDNTFDHGANYTDVPTQNPSADHVTPKVWVIQVDKDIFLFGMHYSIMMNFLQITSMDRSIKQLF